VTTRVTANVSSFDNNEKSKEENEMGTGSNGVKTRITVTEVNRSSSTILGHDRSGMGNSGVEIVGFGVDHV
jgi:hypothetical protein